LFVATIVHTPWKPNNKKRSTQFKSVCFPHICINKHLKNPGGQAPPLCKEPYFAPPIGTSMMLVVCCVSWLKCCFNCPLCGGLKACTDDRRRLGGDRPWLFQDPFHSATGPLNQGACPPTLRIQSTQVPVFGGTTCPYESFVFPPRAGCISAPVWCSSPTLALETHCRAPPRG
jgi:hypothetical protein